MMMQFAADGLQQGWSVFLQLLGQPFYYISVLFVLLQVRKQIYLDRKMFHSKLHYWGGYTWRIVLWGIGAGGAASILMAFIGAALTAKAMLLLWIVSLLLTLIHVRYLCFAYAAGVLGLVQTLTSRFPEWEDAAGIGWFVQGVNEIHMPSLFALVALLHLVEAFLMRRKSARMESPLFLEGKRGKIVGGYHIQGFWPVPLLLIVPSGGGFELPWTPLLGQGMWNGGMALLAFPVLMGFGELVKTQLPASKIRQTSLYLAGYALIVLAFAVCTEYVDVLVPLTALLTIGLHEGIILYSRMQEDRKPPYFVHDGDGLKILGIIPGTPAEQMGLLPGERISKVNGVKVNTKEQMHTALGVQSAYCKLEVINHEGESRFLQRAIYSGEHHQLGIILAPDDDASSYARLSSEPIWSYIAMKFSGWRRRPASGAAERQEEAL
ncbi:PDZ domain-containing protein [Marinicrinis lubricantis]|uniref:PDZ domain-containing protein n=1 Tax=Marinicrinis lubricantis TaxID=2086470 RepID=A0ABW1ITG8_9BACL